VRPASAWAFAALTASIVFGLSIPASAAFRGGHGVGMRASVPSHAVWRRGHARFGHRHGRGFGHLAGYGYGGYGYAYPDGYGGFAGTGYDVPASPAPGVIAVAGIPAQPQSEPLFIVLGERGARHGRRTRR
jgi:hypothetical protein